MTRRGGRWLWMWMWMWMWSARVMPQHRRVRRTKSRGLLGFAGRTHGAHTPLALTWAATRPCVRLSKDSGLLGCVPDGLTTGRPDCLIDCLPCLPACLNDVRNAAPTDYLIRTHERTHARTHAHTVGTRLLTTTLSKVPSFDLLSVYTRI